VIGWVKTQENMDLTQETEPGMYKSREVLIQLPSVRGLKVVDGRLVRRVNRIALGNRPSEA
jgi:hypothetical protein